MATTTAPTAIKDRDRARRAGAVARFTNAFDQWPDERMAAAVFIGGLSSSRTAATYASNLYQYFEWCAKNSVRPYDVVRSQARLYLVSLVHLAPCTRAARATAVHSFYGSVLDEDRSPIDRNPFDRVRPKGANPVKPAPAMTQVEFEELLESLREGSDAYPRRLIHRRDYALLYTMGRIGPRRISVEGLTWGSLQGRGETATMVLHLKGDRYEDVELPPDVIHVLAAWHEALTAALGRALTPRDAIFPPVGPTASKLPDDTVLEPLSTEGISYIARRRLSGIGVVGKGWAAHAFRATAATVAYEQGGTIDEIQSMLCHLNRTQTEAYIRRRTTKSAARHWAPRVPAHRVQAGSAPLLGGVVPLLGTGTGA